MASTASGFGSSSTTGSIFYSSFSTSLTSSTTAGYSTTSFSDSSISNFTVGFLSSTFLGSDFTGDDVIIGASITISDFCSRFIDFWTSIAEQMGSGNLGGVFGVIMTAFCTGLKSVTYAPEVQSLNFSHFWSIWFSTLIELYWLLHDRSGATLGGIVFYYSIYGMMGFSTVASSFSEGTIIF